MSGAAAGSSRPPPRPHWRRRSARVEQWRRRGAAVELLSRTEVQRLTGSSRYCGGLIDRRGGSVQPLAYVRGLAQALLRQGGQLYTHSPALKLARAGQGYRIETPGGSLSAALVIVATNAYTGSLTDPLRRSVVAVPSFQVATAPLARRAARGYPARGAGGVGHLPVAALLSPRQQRSPGHGNPRLVHRDTHDLYGASSLSRRARDLSAARGNRL